MKDDSKARARDARVIRSAQVCRLLLAGLFVLQQPMSTTVIVVDGSCGLADAIRAANTDGAVGGCAAGSGGDEIHLTGDVTLIEPLPRVRGHLTLEGNGHAVTRHPAVGGFRIFEMRGDAPVVLRNMTVSNGHAALGGGIYTEAPLTIVNSTIDGNSADESGGGIHGGWNSNVTLFDSTISNNHSALKAGGMYAAFEGSSGIVGSTISGNTAVTHGGGIYNSGYSYMTITNSTISGNTAGSKGGGIYNTFYAGDIDLINTTIIGNSAANGGGFYAYPSFEAGRTPEGHYTDVYFEGSVFAANVGGNCAGNGQHDLGGNFDDDGSCEGASPIVADVDFDSALADNGGPTRTHALLAGSVAIDAGGACGLTEDQRGFARDALCDSGAYEFGAEPFGLGAKVSGLRTRFVTCRNFTTGDQVRFDAMGTSAWDCEAAGFVAAPGDQIGQTFGGGALGPLLGELTGIVANEVNCRNVSTGQGVTAPVDVALAWDCDAAGLTGGPGDRLQVSVRGVAP